MGTWAFTKALTGTGLLRQFAVLSLIVIVLITTLLSLLISYYLRKDMLEREWRIIAENTHAEALYQLTPADFAAPMTREAQEHFAKLHERMSLAPEVVRINIFNPNMEVIWSTDSRLIGQRFPDNPDLVNALTGRITVDLERDEKPGEESRFDGGSLGDVVEVYVPIVFPRTTRVAGIVETYKIPREVLADVRRGQLVVAVTVVSGGVLVYLSLFWIVRRAARGIESQRALTAHLQAVREEERSSIAHEAREELAQVLTAMKFEVSGMAAALPEERADLGAHVKEMRTLLDGAMESALRIASYSRPALLDTLGLVAALNSEARRFQARTGIQCEVTSNSTHLDLNRETLTVIFRIIQEALSNVARHAQATRVTIGLEKLADGLLLTVEDNGLGIPDRAIGDPKSLGLLGMRESTLLLGGTMLITGTPGKGTRVSVTIPFKGSGGHPLGDTKSV